MKTVKDAVELYKGHFPDGQCGCYDNWSLMVNGKQEEILVFNEMHQICTRQEFEDYAEMQKLNSINKDVVKNQKYTIKDAYNYYKYNVSKKKDAAYIVCNIKDGSFNYIDTNKALSGDFYIVGSIYDFKSYEKSITHDKYSKEKSAIATLENLGYTHNGGELWKPPIENTNLNPEKPVFTHELMVRGGTNSSEQYEPAVKAFSGKKFSVFINENGKEYVRKNSKVKFRLIDSRTDKEKLIDELTKYTSRVIRGYYGDEFTDCNGDPLSKVIIENILDKAEIKLK